MTRPKRSLRRTLLWISAIPMVGVTLVLFAMMMLSAFLLQNDIATQQRLLIAALARQGEQYLNETNRLMQTLAYTLVDFPRDHQAKLLSQARATYPRFTAFYLLDEKGEVVTEDTDRLQLLGLDLSGEQFFRRVKESGRPYFSEPFVSLSSGQVSVINAVPIIIQGRLRGMLVGELNLILLQQSIEEVDLGEDGKSFIVDQRGMLVAYPDPTWVQERRNLSYLPLLQKESTQEHLLEIFYDDNQAQWLIGSVTPMAANWRVVATQPLMVAAQPLIILLVVSGLAFSFSLTLFLWVQMSLLRKITTPIALLAQKAEALAKGEDDALPTAPPGDFSEIISLNQNFASMVEAVKQRTTELVAANQTLQLELQERNRIEVEREQLIAKLEAKNAELERFTYTVSHDLKSPLVTINGFLGWLEKDMVSGDPSRMRVDIGHIHAATAKMQELLDDLLELSRVGRLINSSQWVPLEALAYDAVALVAGQINQCKAQVKIDSPLPQVYGDRARLLEALQNLVDNATKFMGHQPHPQIEIGARLTAEEPVFYVRDNGMGIEPRYHDRVFGLFERLDQKVEGTGIGLALVKRIIELHGGRIWIESKGEGDGAAFCFTLPLPKNN